MAVYGTAKGSGAGQKRTGTRAKAGPNGKAVASGKTAADAKGSASARTSANDKTGANGKSGADRKAAASRKTPAAMPRKRARRQTGKVVLPKGYRPSEDEAFMSRRQREYFRRKLVAWREEILAESRETIHHLQEHSSREPDIADRASIETERLIELRTRDRERKLLSKIDAALERIVDGSYGYCTETGDPISLQRLEARPVATLSIAAQERHERMEKTHRDD